MKVAWVVERATQKRLDEASRVARAGHDVLLICGEDALGADAAESLAASSDSSDSASSRGALSLHVLAREDRHTTHWQKSQSVGSAQAFRELLKTERPDVLHLHGWRGLSRDFVHLAACAGIPALVHLHDHQLTCLLPMRQRPDEETPCERAFSAGTCLKCAQKAGPATPWVPFEAQFMAFAERARDLARELAIARFVLVDSAALAEEVARYWSDFAVEPRAVTLEDVDALEELYEQAVALGCEPGTEGAEEWYAERMRRFAEEEWDRKCAEFESSR